MTAPKASKSARSVTAFTKQLRSTAVSANSTSSSWPPETWQPKIGPRSTWVSNNWTNQLYTLFKSLTNKLQNKTTRPIESSKKLQMLSPYLPKCIKRESSQSSRTQRCKKTQRTSRFPLSLSNSGTLESTSHYQHNESVLRSSSSKVATQALTLNSLKWSALPTMSSSSKKTSQNGFFPRFRCVSVLESTLWN